MPLQLIKELGYKDRKKLMGGLNMRDYIFQQTGISQSQGYKLEYIENNDLKLFNKILKEEVSIRQAYLDLKKINKGKYDTTKRSLKD